MNAPACECASCNACNDPTYNLSGPCPNGCPVHGADDLYRVTRPDGTITYKRATDYGEPVHGAGDGPTPCFCAGPWRTDDPADLPESVLQREHAVGSPGCERGYARPVWVQRMARNARELTR